MDSLTSVIGLGPHQPAYELVRAALGEKGFQEVLGKCVKEAYSEAAVAELRCRLGWDQLGERQILLGRTCS